MTRRALQRFLRQIALASLPTIGGAACWEVPSTAGDGSAILDAAAVDQTAPGDATNLCGPSPIDGCFWYVYVDGGLEADGMQFYQWRAIDGGSDGDIADQPCGPCRFHERTDVWCGACVAAIGACGATYLCALDDCSQQCIAGRRPAGLVAATSPVRLDDAGEWVARMAHLEAASVPAFARLAAELAAHGAPEPLVAGARRALCDEERHARVMSDLARAAGARLPILDVEPMKVRSLEEIALENAVEGCVREAFGAVTLKRQARVVRDPALSDLLAEVAVDEARHGSLARAIDRWAKSRLPDGARRRIAAARLAELRTFVSA